MTNRFYLFLLLGSSLVLLAAGATALHRELTPEWLGVQQAYQARVAKRAAELGPGVSGSVAVALAPPPTGIRQTFIPSLNRADRCATCHLGVENPLMADAPAPHRAHPGDHLKHHPVEKFGCTICHNGQGRALDRAHAHGFERDAHVDYPLVPLEFIESACAQCHAVDRLADLGFTKVREGLALFRDKGCLGCHKLSGKGGVLGKELYGVGSQPIAYFPMGKVRGERTVYGWLKQHFDDPRNLVPTSEMKVEVSEAESVALTAFVLSLRSTEIPRLLRESLTPLDRFTRAEEGAQLYKMYCGACHSDGRESVYDAVFNRTIPAVMNPAFLNLVDDVYLKAIIAEGRAGTPMTAWKKDAAGLSDAEVDAIVAYMASRRTGPPPEKLDVTGLSGDAGRGQELYRVRCASCHGDRGQGGVGPNLRNPVVQKKAPPEFLATTIRVGRAGTHMAAFGQEGVGLSDRDIADLVAHIRSLAKP